MGHSFGLDGAYLLLPEDKLKQEYLRAAADFTFLQDAKVGKQDQEEVKTLQEENRRLAERLKKLENIQMEELVRNLEAKVLALEKARESDKLESKIRSR
jgi:hypothetical protein